MSQFNWTFMGRPDLSRPILLLPASPAFSPIWKDQSAWYFQDRVGLGQTDSIDSLRFMTCRFVKIRSYNKLLKKHLQSGVLTAEILMAAPHPSRPYDCILDAQQLTHIYGLLQHLIVMWPQLSTVLLETAFTSSFQQKTPIANNGFA